METVDKTLDVLEIFLKQEGEAGIAEMARLSGLNISTAYRISSDLVKRGYLRQKQKRGKYSIGIKLLEFNTAIQKTLRVGDIAQPHLMRLSKECGEYSEVAILDNCAAVTIVQAEVDHNLRIKNIVGERLPLHSTSVGKVLLAYMENEEKREYYASAEFRLYTEKTITDPVRMEEEIEKIKRQGFSLDDGEYDLGIWSAAAPIFDFKGNLIAGLAIAAPSYRTDENKTRELTCLVKTYAAGISCDMGFNGLDESGVPGRSIK